VATESDAEATVATDPVGHFLQDMRYHGRSERTCEAYERVLREFESFLEDRGVASPGDADHRDCMAFVHGIRGRLSESTVATYAAYLHRFYAYMTQAGNFDGNPMALVIEEMDESIDTDPARREVSLPAMRSFVREIDHPLHRALVVTMLKTGVRVGELCNLDLRDLSLPVVESFDVTPRPALDNRPGSLYVTAEHTVGDVTDGERRTASNKRKRSTVIPVDGELRRELRRWLAVRPDPLHRADPLFLSTSDSWGERVTPHMVHHIVEGYANDRGWHRPGGGAEENVTPHYFRHFFTTHLRDRTGDRGVVKYLRGDVADDVIDTYTHNWGDRVRDTYEPKIYQLFE
jgi:site-specific recombinase XerD